jgi:hypothetical protein
MLRIYHTHDKWEDLGMWFKNPTVTLETAVNFTGDANLYGSYMWRVVCEWPFTTEHNLTNTNSNRRAWLGHAAAYLAHQIPEATTRKAWGFLTEAQRVEADSKADEVISIWEWQHHRRGIRAVQGAYVDAYLQKGYVEIPDELPNELQNLAPSYKFICQAILKNDLHLTTLGYSKPKSEFYNILKRIELNERANRSQ